MKAQLQDLRLWTLLEQQKHIKKGLHILCKNSGKMSVINLNSENFENEVLKYEGTVIVDFFATWCNPCKMQSPIIDEIAEEKNGIIKVCKLNVDEAIDLAEKYDVMSIPTIIIFNKGNVQKEFIGLTSKEEIENSLNF